MYTIVNVIYGVPVKFSDNDTYNNSSLSYHFTFVHPGFLEYYNGSGHITPRAFGILIDAFDECAYHTELSSIRLQPSEEQIEKYNQLFSSLGMDERADLIPFGKPRVFFLWTTT